MLQFIRAFTLYLLIMGIVVVAIVLYSGTILTNEPLVMIAALILVVKLCMIAFNWFGDVE